MDTTDNWLTHDHHKYDEMLSECEMAAEMADWKDAIRLFDEFIIELKLHMQLEDEVLYPLFEKKQNDDEMSVLHEEHENLIRLLRDLICVIKTKNVDHFIDSLVPLHEAMNEHNKHEEIVFEHLGSDSLLTRRDEIIERLSAIKAEKGYKSKERLF